MKLSMAWLWLFVAGACLGAAAPDRPAQQRADVVLTGEVRGADRHGYLEVPFEVPPGVDRITVAFTYDRVPGVTIDLGLADPERFRGWSGGNKSRFTLAETDATPAYLPGPLPPGEWRLVLGVPGIRDGGVARYRAEIWLQRGVTAFTEPFADGPLANRPGWYRGDLHLHTGHSDGACTTQGGARAPCPLYRTVEAAAARGLDFVAITEHNTRSHFQALRALQGSFDRLVLIPGQELTTFHGHANVLGSTGYLDFRASARDVAAVLDEAMAVGGLVSINHPALPSGERCLGCGWSGPVDASRVHAMEIVNGATMAAMGGRIDHAYSGLGRWEAALDAGARITAVAGSDNHDPLLDPDRPGAVGRPTTVVHATALSQPALLEGIRRGRVFIDLHGTHDRLLDVRAEGPAGVAVMGGDLAAAPGDEITVTVTAHAVADGTLVLISDGRRIPGDRRHRSGDRLEAAFRFRATGQRSWLRAEVISARGEPLLLSNPIYLSFPPPER